MDRIIFVLCPSSSYSLRPESKNQFESIGGFIQRPNSEAPRLGGGGESSGESTPSCFGKFVRSFLRFLIFGENILKIFSDFDRK